VLHDFKISLNNIPTLSLLQFIFKNSAIIHRRLYFLTVQVLNQSLVSTAKWHITLPIYLYCSVFQPFCCRGTLNKRGGHSRNPMH